MNDGWSAIPADSLAALLPGETGETKQAYVLLKKKSSGLVVVTYGFKSFCVFTVVDDYVVDAIKVKRYFQVGTQTTFNGRVWTFAWPDWFKSAQSGGNP